MFCEELKNNNNYLCMNNPFFILQISLLGCGGMFQLSEVLSQVLLVVDLPWCFFHFNTCLTNFTQVSTRNHENLELGETWQSPQSSLRSTQEELEFQRC